MISNGRDGSKEGSHCIYVLKNCNTFLLESLFALFFTLCFVFIYIKFRLGSSSVWLVPNEMSDRDEERE